LNKNGNVHRIKFYALKTASFSGKSICYIFGALCSLSGVWARSFWRAVLLVIFVPDMFTAMAANRRVSFAAD
jgi:hypothetical protein